MYRRPNLCHKPAEAVTILGSNLDNNNNTRNPVRMWPFHDPRSRVANTSAVYRKSEGSKASRRNANTGDKPHRCRCISASWDGSGPRSMAKGGDKGKAVKVSICYNNRWSGCSWHGISKVEVDDIKSPPALIFNIQSAVFFPARSISPHAESPKPRVGSSSPPLMAAQTVEFQRIRSLDSQRSDPLSSSATLVLVG